MENLFEGHYRRTPQQNLSGSSRNNGASQLIDKAKCERKKREESRFALEKILMIQSTLRGHISRKRWRAVLRAEVQIKLNSIVQNESGELIDDLSYIMQRIAFIYRKEKKFTEKTIHPEDMNELLTIITISQKVIVKLIEAIDVDNCWLWRIIHLLLLIFRLMNSLSLEENVKMPLIIPTLASLLSQDLYKNVLSPKDALPVLTRVWGELMKYVNPIQILFREIHLMPNSEIKILKITMNLLRTLINIIKSTKDSGFCENALEIIGSSLTDISLTNNYMWVVLKHLKTMKNFPIKEVARVYLMRGAENIKAESLFLILYLDNNQSSIPFEEQNDYFNLLYIFLSRLYKVEENQDVYNLDDSSSSDDSECNSSEVDKTVLPAQASIMGNSLKLLNTESRAENWIGYLNAIIETNEKNSILTFCKCLYIMWMHEQLPIFSYKVIKVLVFHHPFLQKLWNLIINERIDDSLQIWQILACGITISPSESLIIVPSLTMFCVIFKHNLVLLNDCLFYDEENSGNTNVGYFKLLDIKKISKTLMELATGLISLSYPVFSFDGPERIELRCPTDNISFNTVAWRCLLMQVVGLLRVIYSRDSRRQFTTNGFWISQRVNDIRNPSSCVKNIDDVTPFTLKTYSGKSFSVYENRYLATLQSLPFLIEFLKRFMIFQQLLRELKLEYHSQFLHFLNSDYIMVRIRRDYIYEDAFSQLNNDEVPDCRIHIKVLLISSLGVDELGFDGGGLFREFIIALLKAAFDPNRGFFLMNKDNEVYPNPKIKWIEREYIQHYNFIGRMLGKAIFERVLIELPLAEFFLAQLLRKDIDLDINYMSSLDQDMYKNLLSLTTFNGDFFDLGLDFTLSIEHFGSNEIVELKPDGGNIPVTKDNVLEYIYSVAKYKIHNEISKQCEAFFEGLTSVIPYQWISIFSAKELQLIISGNETPIDIGDLRRSAIYRGGYDDKHPTIELFWRVASSFDREERSRLLKFVTSCSRPPLLGFKDLNPPFCVQFVDDLTLLPSASTCMNTLRLPNLQQEQLLREKILYAINSETGFELI